jgi:hypothetical protein
MAARFRWPRSFPVDLHERYAGAQGDVGKGGREPSPKGGGVPDRGPPIGGGLDGQIEIASGGDVQQRMPVFAGGGDTGRRGAQAPEASLECGPAVGPLQHLRDAGHGIGEPGRIEPGVARESPDRLECVHERAIHSRKRRHDSFRRFACSRTRFFTRSIEIPLGTSPLRAARSTAMVSSPPHTAS